MNPIPSADDALAADAAPTPLPLPQRVIKIRRDNNARVANTVLGAASLLEAAIMAYALALAPGVLARMGVHLANAKRARQQLQAQSHHAHQATQARNALDAFGYASVTVRLRDGRLLWQTALARSLLESYFSLDPNHPMPTLPEAVLAWLRRHLSAREAVAAAATYPSPSVAPLVSTEPPRYSLERGAQRLTFRLHHQAGESAGGADWLLVMQESSDTAIIDAMGSCFKLTGREAEVLYWVVKGKINRDIADIVGASPATVKKHLERVFAKLGVETRTAAAAMAMTRIRQLHPQFEG